MELKGKIGGVDYGLCKLGIVFVIFFLFFGFTVIIQSHNLQRDHKRFSQATKDSI